jgi:C-terminal processing protease CtpA/Prc
LEEGGFMKKALFIGFPVLLGLLLVGYGFSGEDHDRIRIKTPALPMLSGVRLGIVVSEISPHLRQALKIDSGVLVEEVLKDSPAKEAGIQEGDIILKVGNEPVNNQKDVRESLQQLADKEEVEVQLQRDGKPLTIQVKPETNEIQRVIRLGPNYIGVQLQELDSDLAGYFKVDPSAGVLVTNVEKDSPAAKAGTRSGDVLTHFNGQKINSPEEVREELSGLKDGETAEITLIRQGSEKKVIVRPENRPPFHGEFMNQLPEVMSFTQSPEFQEEMNHLKSEIEGVKRDLQSRQQDLEGLKAQIEKEMQSLKEELQKH